jgi:hypothetical protein
VECPTRAAGVWLDTFSMRLGNVHSARWNGENPALCAQHDQQAAQLSRLLRKMTRLLRGLDVDLCCAWARGDCFPTGPRALQEIACQGAALMVELRTAGHPCHDEALCALKDALLDEDDKLIGPWLKQGSLAQ